MTIFLTELILIFNKTEIYPNENIGIKISELILDGNENTKSLGLFLYTDFFIIFQISGFLLLLAMIGAIVLAHEKNENLRNQNPIKQKMLKKKKVIKLN